jgi:SpoVK/Ycf46/Vps4 family AAA+-type ATPase
MKPSIIFFDEIDALAPVRSVRQEQVHTSVVGTLLAEMDGLCDRLVMISRDFEFWIFNLLAGRKRARKMFQAVS